jgi:SPP1 family predicted phage head-tail adaptor
MRIGRRDQRITVQRFVESRNVFNEIEKGWVSIGELWAHHKTQSGKEALQAGQIVSSEVSVFNIRYTSITVQDRLIAGDKIYDIQAINPLGRRKELELLSAYNETATLNELPVILLENGSLMVSE